MTLAERLGAIINKQKQILNILNEKLKIKDTDRELKSFSEINTYQPNDLEKLIDGNIEVLNENCFNGIKRIKQDAIVRLPELKKVVFPENIEYLQYGNFNDCPKLQQIIIKARPYDQSTGTGFRIGNINSFNFSSNQPVEFYFPNFDNLEQVSALGYPWYKTNVSVSLNMPTEDGESDENN